MSNWASRTIGRGREGRREEKSAAGYLAVGHVWGYIRFTRSREGISERDAGGSHAPCAFARWSQIYPPPGVKDR